MPHVARDMPVQYRRKTDAPEARTAEAEEALKTISGIRHKLSILGMPKRDIDQLMKKGEATGIATVYASMYGQVSEQNAFEGSYVNTGIPIFTLADPKYIWLRLDAYESDYPWIRKGQPVEFQTEAYPGERFSGKVVYTDPVFNPETRTFTIGVVCPEDRGGRLKAGMLVRAAIHARLTADGSVADESGSVDKAPLTIPASAPLITGARAIVYVASREIDGEFEGREIMLGPKAGDDYIVAAGLEAGERVVVNGNFRIDSAVQIRATSGMMAMADGHSATGHAYHGGSRLMDASYAAERKLSRMGVDAHEAYEHEYEREHEMEEHGRRPRTNVHRRKPGQYGDTTRSFRNAEGRAFRYRD